MRRLVATVFCITMFAPAPALLAQAKETIQGYAEWRSGTVLVVDGQRVRPGERTRYTDRRWDAIELGDEVKVEGERQPDGSFLARVVTAKANGTAVFEEDAIDQANQAEDEWLKAGEIADDEEDAAPPMKIYERGRRVDRVRAIVNRLVPGYLDRDAYRVYVIDSKDWNAFAMANGSIWVNTGLMADMDDDELAIVLGHELVHVTHEHLRKSMKKDMWYGLLQAGVGVMTDSDTAAVIAAGISLVRENKYSRDLEDQADRVGLRYAYEAGFDTSVAPRLWRRFDEKYGSEDKVTNYLLGDHSRAVDRVRKLDTQIALNYRDGAGGRMRRQDAQSTGGRTDPEPATRKPSRTATPTTAAPAPAESRSLADALASLKKGMTPDEVVVLLGKPVSFEKIGDRLVLHYEDDFDVQFVDGRLYKVKPRSS
ncbi:MAG: M48 family metalloprotease [Acidobacteria bacterium]|nr:M48 family metalloprotease [Acidobacteriota bacterium]